MPTQNLVCTDTQCSGKRDNYFRMPSEDMPACPECGKAMKPGVNAAGGYKMKGDNSASRTPKGSGSW